MPQKSPTATTEVNPSKQRRAIRRPVLPFRRHGVAELQGDPHRHTRRSNVVISWLVLTLLLSAIMLLPGSLQQEGVQANAPSSQDMYAPTDARFESMVLTEQARQSAREDPAHEVWVQDSEVVASQRSDLMGNLAVMDMARGDETIFPRRGADLLSEFKGITLTVELLNTVLAMPQNEYSNWRTQVVLGTFNALMREGRISSEADLAAARAALPNRVPPYLSDAPKAAAIAFLSPRLAVNMQLDVEETARRRSAAAGRIQPVVVTVQRGEAIVKQGELITPLAFEKLQRVGLLRDPLSALGMIGAAGMVAILMLLLHLYMYRAAEHVWRRYKQLILFGMLIMVTVGVARLFLPGHALLPYFLPVAAVSMLIAALLDTNLAVVTTLVLSVLLGIAIGGVGELALDLPIYYLVGGLTGIFTLTRIEKVSSFMISGVSIALALFSTALLMRALGGHAILWSDVSSLALAVGFNAGVSTAITYAAFSILGALFGITTPVQLMELAHPDQPLLRRLMQEAPGTYHHSLVVGNLAERAAEMVGADPLLTRVCAFYHDIGKAERPYYFIDNQAGMSNLHDELDPKRSAQIIMDHVHDGLRLGQKARLPRRVLDAIPQHHGTMLVKYFYYKAREQDPTVSEAEFRYPGPKPQTKESAILMLADGVEATVRAMAQGGTLDKIAHSNSDASESYGLYRDTASLPDDALASVVHRIISERIEDGQLDECDLTVRDIVRIQEAFVSMLKGIYHPRVQYPDAATLPRTSPDARGESMGETAAGDADTPSSSVLAGANETATDGALNSALGKTNGHSGELGDNLKATPPEEQDKSMEKVFERRIGTTQ